MKMHLHFILFVWLQILTVHMFGQNAGVFNIKNFGAKGDNKTLNTAAFKKAIDACSAADGGTVVVPPGTYLSGTIQLKSNITLLLEKGSVIRGVSNPDEYTSYVPVKDMSKYHSAGYTRWNRALLLGVNVENVTITGMGIIDGNHVFDPQGEERMRGPHAILFAESRNLSFSGFTVECAANYGLMGYELENTVFQNLAFNQGWDGIHIRGGKHIIIRNSEFHTGDDAIAGGYWENVVITDCDINSSCNGIRMIMPSVGLTISHCRIFGPGKFYHRTSKEKQRTNTLSAIILQPGGWGKTPGKVDGIHIHDINIDQVDNPLMINLYEENPAGEIIIERINATNINAFAASIESWKGSGYDKVILRDISFEYKGHPAGTDIELAPPPHADARNLPYWGFFVRNVKAIHFENVELKVSGTDNRPAIGLDNTETIIMRHVKYPEQPGVQSVVLKNCGTMTIDPV